MVRVKSTTHELGTSAATDPSSCNSSGLHAVKPRPNSFIPSPHGHDAKASRQTSMYGGRPGSTTSGASPTTTTSPSPSSSGTRRTAAPPRTSSRPSPMALLSKRQATSSGTCGNNRPSSACSCEDRGTTNFAALCHASDQAANVDASAGTAAGANRTVVPIQATGCRMASRKPTDNLLSSGIFAGEATKQSTAAQRSTGKRPKRWAGLRGSASPASKGKSKWAASSMSMPALREKLRTGEGGACLQNPM
mmetsp:Transcript_126805/g.364722  ORF Transcript_126805/g.364722 Transcript_126805/m.364722 type:complete len:249 (-) Transcript_126805:364-1110(-)